MDPDLWARFQEGEEAAFRTVLQRFSPRILAFLRSRAEDEDQVQDLLQETWIRAFAHRARCAAPEAFSAWTLSIARNVARDHFRSEEARRERESGDSRSVVPGSFSAGSRPDADLESQEARTEITRALLSLPDLQRDVAVLRLLEGLSTRETAERLGCAEGTVKASLHRALGKLKSRLQETSP